MIDPVAIDRLSHRPQDALPSTHSDIRLGRRMMGGQQNMIAAVAPDLIRGPAR